MKSDNLTDKEKQSIKVLNFIAEWDGVITDEEDIKAILYEGIRKFISKKETTFMFNYKNSISN